MRRYKPWEAKPPERPSRYAADEYPCVLPEGRYPITDRTVVLDLRPGIPYWFTGHIDRIIAWIREQKLSMVNYCWLLAPNLAYRPNRLAVTFRTKEDAALFKLFWYGWEDFAPTK
jgi:hypothetical protein